MNFTEPANKKAYLLASKVKWLALLSRSFSLKYVEIVGIHTGMRIVYLGEGESLNYFSKILTGTAGECSVTKLPLWRLGKTVRRLNSPDTLLCLEVNRLLRFMVPDGALMTFPWVRQRVFLNSREYRNSKRRIEDNFGRKVRKYKYTFRMVNDAESVECFYSELYVPHITKRFKDVHLRSLAELLEAVKSGFLLQVLHNDLWVSGSVCRLGDNELTIISFGHLPDETFPLRFGALSAVYYFLLEYARKHSLACVDLVRSRPHADDGVYRHKQSWGAVTEIDCWPHTAIWMFPPTSLPIPHSLEKLLIWEGKCFSEMGEVCTRQQKREA